MNILITGAKGFVGKNLTEALKNIRDGKDRTRPELVIGEIYEYDIDTDPALLGEYAAKADFVFNLAGINRPQNKEEFMTGNFGFADLLLRALEKHKNTCPVMISSSIQATLITEEARGQVKSSSLLTEKKPEQRFSFTVSRIFSENGRDLIITLPSQPFAVILQMTCLLP